MTAKRGRRGEKGQERMEEEEKASQGTKKKMGSPGERKRVE
jgi:hypothetical protein